MSTDEFKRRIDAGDLVEWEEVYPGRFYGTLRDEVERIWSEGRHAIFDIDVVGGLDLKALYGDRALAVFVSPPSIAELERRLRARRTEDGTDLEERIGKARHEMDFAGRFDAVIVNDDLQRAQREAGSLVRRTLEG